MASNESTTITRESCCRENEQSRSWIIRFSSKDRTESRILIHASKLVRITTSAIRSKMNLRPVCLRSDTAVSDVLVLMCLCVCVCVCVCSIRRKRANRSRCRGRRGFASAVRPTRPARRPARATTAPPSRASTTSASIRSPSRPPPVPSPSPRLRPPPTTSRTSCNAFFGAVFFVAYSKLVSRSPS